MVVQPVPAVPPAPPAVPVTPFVYEVVEQTTPSTTVVDYLLGAFAVVGTLAVAAIVLGLLFAGTLIAIRRSRGTALTGDGSTSIRLDLGARVADPASAAEEAPASGQGHDPAG